MGGGQVAVNIVNCRELKLYIHYKLLQIRFCHYTYWGQKLSVDK